MKNPKKLPRNIESWSGNEENTLYTNLKQTYEVIYIFFHFFCGFHQIDNQDKISTTHNCTAWRSG